MSTQKFTEKTVRRDSTNILQFVFFCFFSTQNLFLGREARQSLEKDMGFLWGLIDSIQRNVGNEMKRMVSNMSYFIFTPFLWKMIQFDSYFSDGWFNHQLGKFSPQSGENICCKWPVFEGITASYKFWVQRLARWLHPWKPTWIPKMVLLNMAIFGIYVKFLGCILFVISLQLMFVRPNLGMKFSSESGLKYRLKYQGSWVMGQICGGVKLDTNASWIIRDFPWWYCLKFGVRCHLRYPWIGAHTFLVQHFLTSINSCFWFP